MQWGKPVPEERKPEQKEKNKTRQESLGQYLKRERMLRNITLEDVSQVTKISQRFLTALEEDNYRILPAETFVKGFLRSYAKTIGLDPYEVILVYEEYSKTKENNVDLRTLLEEEEEDEEMPKKSVKVPLLISTIVVIAVAAAGYFGWELFRYIEHRDVAEPNKPGIENEVLPRVIAKDPGKAVAKKHTSPTKLPQLEPLEMAAQAQTDAQWLNSSEGKNWLTEEKNQLFSDRLSLAIKAKSDIWARVSLDPPGGPREETILGSGLTRIWFAKDKFILVFDKLNDAKVELNGKELELIDNKQPLQEITITRDNIQ